MSSHLPTLDQSTMKYQGDPDKFQQVNISLTLRIGLISFLLSIFLTLVHAVKKEYRETLTFLVTALATSAGGTSAFYALRSIQQNVESQVIDRTLVYITRWNDPEYLPVRKTAAEIYHLISGKSVVDQEKILTDYLDQNPDKKQDITNVLNFLEEMAICIEKGIIKEDLIYNFYRYIVLTYCETFAVFITQNRRMKNNSSLYKGLTDLDEKWKNY